MELYDRKVELCVEKVELYGRKVVNGSVLCYKKGRVNESCFKIHVHTDIDHDLTSVSQYLSMIW